MYCQTSDIRHTKSQYLKVYRLALKLFSPNPLERCEVENDDVVGASPTGVYIIGLRMITFTYSNVGGGLLKSPFG